MFDDQQIQKQITIDTELMGYDWTFWRLKLAIRDIERLRRRTYTRKIAKNVGDIEYNQALVDVKHHLQRYFDKEIDTLCG